DMLVLYTDGVIEARSPSGAFYPLAERVASFPATNPDTLLHHIHRDLLDHVGGHLADGAALLVIERTPSHRPHLTPHPPDGHPTPGRGFRSFLARPGRTPDRTARRDSHAVVPRAPGADCRPYVACACPPSVKYGSTTPANDSRDSSNGIGRSYSR
ncbi:SpoIIE family protein phosphatase, partial [Streptomyces sp. NPDC057557]|uniref:SpoIIE family protein phosphatase n=1 Tax=Streptomyces sp. NPDC057557 TaxID=3346167 RepID=UPI0036AE0503